MLLLIKVCPVAATHKNKNKPTITNISDELWNIISSTLPTEKPNNTIGRPIIPFRKVMDGILYVLKNRLSMEDAS